MVEYWMEVDAVCLAELSGLPLEEARAVVRADWAAGGPGGNAWTFVVPAGAERLAVAGDVIAEGQAVFRYIRPLGLTSSDGSVGEIVNVESPFAGTFEAAEAGRFRVVARGY